MTENKLPKAPGSWFGVAKDKAVLNTTNFLLRKIGSPWLVAMLGGVYQIGLNALAGGTDRRLSALADDTGKFIADFDSVVVNYVPGTGELDLPKTIVMNQETWIKILGLVNDLESSLMKADVDNSPFVG